MLGSAASVVSKYSIVSPPVVPTPLRIGTAVNHFCMYLFLFYRDVAFSLFCDHGLNFRGRS